MMPCYQILFLPDFFLFSLRLRLTVVLFTCLVKNHNSYQTAVLLFIKVIVRVDKKQLLLTRDFNLLSTSIKLKSFSKRLRLMELYCQSRIQQDYRLTMILLQTQLKIIIVNNQLFCYYLFWFSLRKNISLLLKSDFACYLRPYRSMLLFYFS